MKKVRRKIAVLLAATMLLSESAMINVFAEDVQMPQKNEVENVAESDEAAEEVLEGVEKTEGTKENVEGEENPETQEESEIKPFEPQEESDDVPENNAEEVEESLPEELLPEEKISLESNVKVTSILGYSAHVQSIGWQKEVSDGETAGTTGKNKGVEAFKIDLKDPQYEKQIEYRAHVQDIGWQEWVSEGEVAGTTQKNKRIEALQIRTKGKLAEDYDVYYRVHAANFGWLGWTCNGEMAGTSGWAYAAEAFEISLVKKGENPPGDTNDAYIPGAWEVEYQQVEESTKVQINLKTLEKIVERNVATSLKIIATMEYGGAITRKVTEEKSIKEIIKSGFVMDFQDYGKFEITAEFKKNDSVVRTKKQIFGVTASEYNLAPISATFPVVLFSLSLWDIREGENGAIPTIVMLDRPSAYNWDELPEGVYGIPYLTKDALKKKANYTAFQQYVKDLYEISPESKFNLYINDLCCSLIHNMIYANRMKDGQYTITLLSDGSGSFGIFNETYEGNNPQQKHNELVKTWRAGKTETYRTGVVSDEWGWHKHWDCMYAILECEPTAQWWAARNDLFVTSDSIFTEKAKNSITVKNIGSMLTALQNKGDKVVEEFKKLYDFNDGYFKEAEMQGKKAMMLLGTYVENEKGFEDYANLTKLYYGDEYLYYYKGHPKTPTGLYPSKQEQLERLGIADVDSSIAAELILFFNPELSLSGYGTSTFNSANEEMACGLFAQTKEQAFAEGGSVDYSGIDWFASEIDLNNVSEEIKKLCQKGNKNYLVEFSDIILEQEEHDIAIFDATKGTLSFYKKVENGYEKVRVLGENSGINYRAHVADIGWQSYVRNGKEAGTTGKNKAMQALEIKLGDFEYEGGVTYQAHVQNIGWQEWASDGKMAGTTGKNLPMEAVKIKLTGDMAKYYDVYYRVHAQNFGWLDWAKNGQVAGTTGYAYRIEAIQIQLIEKGGKAPGKTDDPMKQRYLRYQAHVQNIGTQKYVYDGEMAGTEGEALALESLKINALSFPSSAIKYQAHVRNIGWQNWVAGGQTAGTEGKVLPMEAIKIKLDGGFEEKYDIYYQVHSKNFGWLDWAKNGEAAGTEGYVYQMEAIRIKIVEKGAEAPGKTNKPFIKK